MGIFVHILSSRPLMNAIYILGSFISTLGSIILLIAFAKNFRNLNLIQKSGIILVEIGVIIPFLIGFINGFINNIKI